VPGDTDGFHVRPAGGDEGPRCVAVAEDLPGSFTPSGVDELRRDLETDDVTVAVAGEQVVGFAVTRHKTPGIVEIRWLAVAGPFQRRGIGTALVTRAGEDSSRIGARLLEVKTLDASVLSAEYAATRRFYEARGFELLETIDPFPGWDPGNPCAIYVKVLG
jgi:ribosomal protein S18 acetylase RimI-like enzyme